MADILVELGSIRRNGSHFMGQPSANNSVDDITLFVDLFENPLANVSAEETETLSDKQIDILDRMAEVSRRARMKIEREVIGASGFMGATYPFVNIEAELAELKSLGEAFTLGLSDRWKKVLKIGGIAAAGIAGAVALPSIIGAVPSIVSGIGSIAGKIVPALTGGASGLIGQLFGAGKTEEAAQAVATTAAVGKTIPTAKPQANAILQVVQKLIPGLVQKALPKVQPLVQQIAGDGAGDYIGKIMKSFGLVQNTDAMMRGTGIEAGIASKIDSAISGKLSSLFGAIQGAGGQSIQDAVAITRQDLINKAALSGQSGVVEDAINRGQTDEFPVIPVVVGVGGGLLLVTLMIAALKS
jgi:hypothetical protein